MRLNHKIYGAGSPVVILHGLFGMMDNWQTMGRMFADAGYMAVLPDLRDHGRSPHTEEFNYHVLADDIRHFLEDNWIYRSVVIGHSMGGKVAMQFASEYEDMVSRLVVIDIAPKRYPPGHHDVIEALLSVDIASLAGRVEAQNILEEKLHDPGTVQFLLKNLSRNKEGGYAWKMNLQLLIKSYANILDEVKPEHVVEVPSLFVRGSNSDYVSDSDFQDILTMFPHATFDTIEGAGHWVHADKPNELFEKIIHFIRQ